jgi:hypothetical protein
MPSDRFNSMTLGTCIHVGYSTSRAAIGSWTQLPLTTRCSRITTGSPKGGSTACAQSNLLILARNSADHQATNKIAGRSTPNGTGDAGRTRVSKNPRPRTASAGFRVNSGQSTSDPFG